jgi:hypothetical protein
VGAADPVEGGDVGTTLEAGKSAAIASNASTSSSQSTLGWRASCCDRTHGIAVVQQRANVPYANVPALTRAPVLCLRQPVMSDSPRARICVHRERIGFRKNSGTSSIIK